MSQFDELRQELLEERRDNLLRQGVLGPMPEKRYGPTPLTGLGETFKAGVRSTAQRVVGSDIEYFKAIANSSNFCCPKDKSPALKFLF